MNTERLGKGIWKVQTDDDIFKDMTFNISILYLYICILFIKVSAREIMTRNNFHDLIDNESYIPELHSVVEKKFSRKFFCRWQCFSFYWFGKREFWEGKFRKRILALGSPASAIFQKILLIIFGTHIEFEKIYNSLLFLLALQRNSDLPSATLGFLSLNFATANRYIIPKILPWLISKYRLNQI